MRETADLLVIGAGVFGLWTARAAARLGLRVILAEAGRPGSGASGGVVGALTPHAPGRWRPFKEFQLQALLALGDRAKTLRDETGVDPGYARVGRITPLADEAARARALAQAGALGESWSGRADLEVLDAVPAGAAGLIDRIRAPCGVIRDTVSARIDPRRLVAALEAAVAREAEIRTGWRLLALDAATGVARLDRGEIAAGQVVLATGWRALGQIGPQFTSGARPGPRGVKGQAAVLAATIDPACPVVHAPGLFIVAHGAGRVAVGSTSEPDWTHSGPDATLDAVIDAARALAPALRDAPVVERWVGIRPRAPGREPVAGRLPGAPRTLLATGGYKIGLGIAHLVGEALAAEAAGAAPAIALPASFRPEAHGLGAGQARICPR